MPKKIMTSTSQKPAPDTDFGRLSKLMADREKEASKPNVQKLLKESIEKINPPSGKGAPEVSPDMPPPGSPRRPPPVAPTTPPPAPMSLKTARQMFGRRPTGMAGVAEPVAPGGIQPPPRMAPPPTAPQVVPASSLGQFARGGKVKSKNYVSGGSVGSASKRADGCAQRGKTKGKMI